MADSENSIAFDQQMLEAVYRALMLIPKGFAPAAAEVRGMIGDFLAGMDESFLRDVQPLPDGFRLTLDFDYAGLQSAVNHSEDQVDLANRLADLLAIIGGQQLIELVFTGISNGALAEPGWLSEAMKMKMHTTHAVNSMAKYDREQRDKCGDQENANAVLGKMAAKGVRVADEKLPALVDRLKQMFLERRTAGPVREAVERRVAQPAHPEYGACTADRAFGELIVQAFAETGDVQFQGDFWWVVE